VRLLIDSHAFLWWSEASAALGAAARTAIANPASEILVSVAGLWELTIKQSLGRLSLPDDLEVMVANQGLSVLPITFVHLRQGGSLPRRNHRDPFDRMMIAQALAEGIPIATGDPIFVAYGVQIIW
jgi:PIN domain nuclease of toxin-antitoxin system